MAKQTLKCRHTQKKQVNRPACSDSDLSFLPLLLHQSSHLCHCLILYPQCCDHDFFSPSFWLQSYKPLILSHLFRFFILLASLFQFLIISVPHFPFTHKILSLTFIVWHMKFIWLKITTALLEAVLSLAHYHFLRPVYHFTVKFWRLQINGTHLRQIGVRFF